MHSDVREHLACWVGKCSALAGTVGLGEEVSCEGGRAESRRLNRSTMTTTIMRLYDHGILSSKI